MKLDTAADSFQRLIEIMQQLRGPGGCPWDRAQTIGTLRRYLIEEAYEVLEAIEHENWAHLVEELGDLQLQIVFQAQIASEAGYFKVEDVLSSINEKLVRRHPHVFADEVATTAEDVIQRWEEIKAKEMEAKRAATWSSGGDRGVGALGEIKRTQPAMLEALQLGKDAAKVGFDWKSFYELSEKLREELLELEQARKLPLNERAHRLEEELGDLLFTVVNIARHVEVDPELALRTANRKFRERFSYIERRLIAKGKSFGKTNIRELEDLWKEAKKTQCG